jgi:hypothetical protein
MPKGVYRKNKISELIWFLWIPNSTNKTTNKKLFLEYES